MRWLGWGRWRLRVLGRCSGFSLLPFVWFDCPTLGYPAGVCSELWSSCNASHVLHPLSSHPYPIRPGRNRLASQISFSHSSVVSLPRSTCSLGWLFSPPSPCLPVFRNFSSWLLPFHIFPPPSYPITSPSAPHFQPLWLFHCSIPLFLPTLYSRLQADYSTSRHPTRLSRPPTLTFT